MKIAIENNTLLNLPLLYNSAGGIAKTLLPGTAHFIIGDHASGKTTLAAAVAATYAVNSELPCYFFTNGEPKERLEKMMSCSLNISEGKLPNELEIHIIENSVRYDIIKSYVKARVFSGLVIIDSFQGVSGEMSVPSDMEEKIMHNELKQIVKEKNISMLFTSCSDINGCSEFADSIIRL